MRRILSSLVLAVMCLAVPVASVGSRYVKHANTGVSQAINYASLDYRWVADTPQDPPALEPLLFFDGYAFSYPKFIPEVMLGSQSSLWVYSGYFSTNDLLDGNGGKYVRSIPIYDSSTFITLQELDLPLGYYTAVLTKWVITGVNISRGVSNTINFAVRDPIMLPEPPYREGHTFVGWYLDEALTIPYDGRPIYEDTILYAKFEINKYSVTLVNTHPSQSPITVDWGTVLDAPSAGNYLGHDFGGWYTSADYTTLYDFDRPVTADLTLYAKWDIKYYTVTFWVDEGVYATIQVPYGATLADIIRLLRDAGYMVEDSVYDSDGNVVGDITVVDDIALYGKLEPLGFWGKAGKVLDDLIVSKKIYFIVGGIVLVVGVLIVVGNKKRR